MLKVESLGICAGLTAEEKMAPAKVEITSGDTTIAKGTCLFTRDGMNVIGSVSAAGVVDAAVELTKPEDLKLVAEKTVTREVAVKKNAALIKTGVPKANIKTAKVDNAEVTPDEDGNLPLSPAAAEDKICEVELTVTAEAPFVLGNSALGPNHKMLLDAGPVHFSMIVEAEKSDHSKHSKTRCTVRGRKPWKNTGDDGPLHIDPTPVEAASGSGSGSGSGNP